jgi:serine/threonine-protein kinase
MATVYLARYRGVGGFAREVAIKKLHPHLLNDVPDAALDLIEEAKLASRIRHPNVVPVLDVGDGPDGVFLVMEYIEGETLSAVLRAAAAAGAPLAVPIALRIIGDVLAGLHAAHELRDERGAPAGLVHRDFSPQNILLGTDGVARLTDFGIAKAANRIGSTQTGLVKGKVSYMPPEQARGKPLDRRCDVWAAGVVAWEIFAGRRLFSPKMDQVAVVMAIVSEPLPRLRSVRPDVPAELDEAIAWALQGDPAERCPSAEELRQRILRAWGREERPAEAAEVAAHVAKVAAPKLSERRRRVEEAQSVTLPRVASTLPGAPTAPPASARAASSDSSASSASLGRSASSAPPMTAEDTVQTVTAEIATDLSVSLPRAHAAGASMSAGEPITSSSFLPSQSQLGGSGRRRRLAVTAGSVAVVAGVALWAVSALLGGGAGSETASSAPGEAAPADPAAASQARAPAAPGTTTAPATAAAAPQASARSALTVQANAPIAQLRLGERVIAVASPSKSVTVELLPEERGQSLSVQAIAVDGRRALAENVSGAAALVTFDSASKAAAKPRKPSGGAPAKSSLMASPYEK